MKPIFLLVVCSFFTLCFSFRMVEAQNEPAPFLYYYSESLRTFVIERADGTDSRVLSQVEMPEATEDVRAIGWSPSGEWLAWTSTNDIFANYPSGSGRNSTSSRERVWVANIDGVRRLDVLTDVRNPYILRWSPLEDLLFVVDLEVESQSTTSLSSRVYIYRFFLVDVSADRIIATSETDFAPSEFGSPVWTDDGQFVAFEYTLDHSDHTEASEAFIRRVSRNGTIDDISIPSRSGFKLRVTGLTQNWILTRSEDFSQLLTVNVVTGETIEFDVLSPIESVFLYDWSPSEEYVLLYVRTPENKGDFELWLLSVADKTLELITKNARNFTSDPTSKLSTWFPWSFYANYAIFYTDDGLYGLEVEPELQVFQITTDRVGIFSPEWYLTGDRLYFFAQEYDAVTNTAGEGQYYSYNFLTHTLAEQDRRFSPYRSNFSEQFVVLENPFSVLDRETSSTYLIPPDSRAQSGSFYHLEAVYWHRSRPWMITSETDTTDIYGYDQLYMSVNDAFGTIHREIAQCYYYCAAWLPDTVLAHVESE